MITSLNGNEILFVLQHSGLRNPRDRSDHLPVRVLYSVFFGLPEQAENLRAAREANEMTMGSYWMAGLSLLALVSAICIFRLRFRWLVVSVIGIATRLPAPLAIIVLMRLWRKDVWNSFH